MGKIALLLLIVAALLTFAIQNQAPIALVVLGTQTLALPLALWVLAALGAGSFTALLLTGFFSLSKAGAVRRAAQRLSDSRSPWGGVGTKRGAAESSGTRARDTVGFRATDRSSEGQSRRPSNDDWEQSNIDRETWDDWGEPTTPRRSPQSTSKTNIRDAADDDWARWDHDRSTGEPPRRSESRTEFTARPPVDRHREVQDNPPERNSERRNGVYDAEYRVLVPPYGSQPAPATPAPPPKTTPSPEPDPLDDDDDWGLDDLDLKK